MKKILITGGTVFVSKRAAERFKLRGYDVYVLNRGTRRQVNGVTHIQADRNNLQKALKNHFFDAVIDVCAYTQDDIKNLLDGIGGFTDYVFISSSAVYPETNEQPFAEIQPVGQNKFWGRYGTNKIDAERYLLSRVPNAYIVRPPYIYGAGQNIYREPFIFDCAMQGRIFYIPNDGKMKMQFIHVDDLCRFMEILLERRPENHIFNVGNNETVDINQYVEFCYKIVGAKLEKIFVQGQNQRDYFPFHNYGYELDVTEQNCLMSDLIRFFDGLKDEYEWYKNNESSVNKKNYIDFIDKNFKGI